MGGFTQDDGYVRGLAPTHDCSSFGSLLHELVSLTVLVCVFYYCRTYYKAVRVGGGGEWRTCAMRYDEPRLVWTRLTTTH